VTGNTWEVFPSTGNGIYGGSGTIFADAIATTSGSGFSIKVITGDEFNVGDITNATGGYGLEVTSVGVTIGNNDGVADKQVYATTAFTGMEYEGNGLILRDTAQDSNVSGTYTINGGTIAGGFRGYEYSTNYSSNFSNLSLVTKQYVDSVAVGGGGNGIYGGSDTVPINTVVTIDSGLIFRGEAGVPFFRIDMENGLAGSFFNQIDTQIYARYYDIASDNRVVVRPDGVHLEAITPDKIFLDGITRFEDLTTTTLTDSMFYLVGAAANGDAGRVYVGDGLSFYNDTLSAVGSGGGANLDFNGTVSPITLRSDSGTDVNFKDSTGITIKQVGEVLTILNTSPDQVVSLTGGGISNITGSYPNFTITSTEVDGSVTNEIQNLSYTAGTGAIGISSGTGTTIPVMTSSTRGLVPDGDGAGTDEFLREDGTWAVPPGGGGDGIYGGNGTIAPITVATLTSGSTFEIKYNGGSTDALYINDGAPGVLLATESQNGIIILRDTASVFFSPSIDMTGVLRLRTQTGGAGTIRLFEPSASGTQSTTITAGAQAANLTYILPLADGVDGEYLKFTTGGQLDWATPSGGTPAGANYQVQYYDTGAFGAEAAFNYNPTNNQLVVGHTTTGATIHGRYHAYNGGSVFRFETKSGSDILNLYENGYLKFGNGEVYPRFYQSATSGGSVDSLASGIVANVSVSSVSGNEDMFSVHHPSISPTSGDKTALKVKGTFDPTSGTANYIGVDVTPTINQTGSSSGVAYGLKVTPTLTDHTQFYGLFLSFNPANDSYGVYQSGANVSNYFAGNIGVGSGNTAPSSLIDLAHTNGYDQLVLRTPYTPTSSADTNGDPGQVAWDNNYIYIQVSGGVWKRAALSSF